MRSAGTPESTFRGPPIDLLTVTDRTLSRTSPPHPTGRCPSPAGSTRCATRRRCSSSCCATSPARCSSCTRALDAGEEPQPDPDRRRRSPALTAGTFLTVTGELKHDERVKLGGLEVKIETLDVAGAALDLPIADDSSVDKRLDWRFLDLRRPEQNLVFRVQTTFLHALRTWWVEHDFVEIHTPKLMATRLREPRRAVRGRLLRGQGVSRAEPAVLQADGAAGRLRQGLRGRARRSAPTRRFTVAARDRVHLGRRRDLAGSTATKTSWRCTSSCWSPASTAVKEKHGDEIEAAFGVEVTVPTTAVPAHPARRGEAHRRRARLRGAARRRRHGPRGRAPASRST